MCLCVCDDVCGGGYVYLCSCSPSPMNALWVQLRRIGDGVELFILLFKPNILENISVLLSPS